MKELTHQNFCDAVEYNPETGTFAAKTKRLGVPAYKARLGTPQGHGYMAFRVFGVKKYSHQWAFFYMTGSFPADEVDHINGVRSDNRWSNLRPADRKVQTQNSKRQSNNTSGFTGVSWSKQRQKWHARIVIGRKAKHLGFYDDVLDAAIAYRNAKSEVHTSCPVMREDS